MVMIMLSLPQLMGFAGTSVQYKLEINLFAGEPNQR